MKYILVLFFTLNTMLPASGYAGFLVVESKMSVMMDKVISSHSKNKCHITNTEMDTNCNIDCCFTHCASMVILPAVFEQNFESMKEAKIISSFKYFYSRTISPELPPPLV